jgi:hypothetical protein
MERELPTLALHGINGESAGNYHLINEESTGGRGFYNCSSRRSSTSSSEDEEMDWSDNLQGLKDLYDEGRALVLKEQDGEQEASQSAEVNV